MDCQLEALVLFCVERKKYLSVMDEGAPIHFHLLTVSGRKLENVTDLCRSRMSDILI